MGSSCEIILTLGGAEEYVQSPTKVAHLGAAKFRRHKHYFRQRKTVGSVEVHTGAGLASGLQITPSS
eukprot:5045876-Pleurochrysis_carterae.AAC.3